MHDVTISEYLIDLVLVHRLSSAHNELLECTTRELELATLSLIGLIHDDELQCLKHLLKGVILLRPASNERYQGVLVELADTIRVYLLDHVVDLSL